ncbi:Rec8 like protein-domain-containing protein [Cryomyces antarcticus]|uniref:Sister chromatid cohesion protein 1 n=1 Tax=Cryomyces antarcticus TaxID=329879 RepID=A0ABR0M6T0_9PEZI|nr:sister chromatid cohesion protein 1 [Cryomyces antarcticus]KAK5161591.1 hypothetical protein LTR04_004114 [Oleoguttula sp. CCFEE 6159]KAK5287342.1 sister chromatid cohesion protein 1 [Cryomyces antarcticus]
MFYSETLLSKTGPLARVWLAANLERKLSKSNILQTDIDSSVHAIVDTGQAPMALRLSGQLLLGVVRIYSRKARYLLDDCNEALLKIKMAFRPGNVDLPADQSHAVNPMTLTLPDAITELDLFAPMPDPSLLLSQPLDLAPGQQDPTLLDWGTSQLLSESIEAPRGVPEEGLRLHEDDLGLDLGIDVTEPTIEVGRRAPTPRREFADDSMMYAGDDLGLDLGEGERTPRAKSPTLPAIGEEDVTMGGMGVFPVPALESEGQRSPISPLSSIRSSTERELERTFQLEHPTAIEGEEDELAVQARQRVKRRRVLPADTDTEIHTSQIRAQQNDRSKILKPASFLPRDPMLLALMNMQRTGGFVSSILGDGRSTGWAPELRGILSLEVVRRSGDLKRKRDLGIVDIEEEQAAQAGVERSPRLSIEPGLLEELPTIEELPPLIREEESPETAGMREEVATSPPPGFDDTAIPLLHPAEGGPVSVGTMHAVHLLRERFGPEAAENAALRQQTSVLFQDLLPEATTSKTDATKMFFEILVLATKDAIKVEQPDDVLGGPIRVRGKRGLWGSWAETQVGGDAASQQASGGAVAEAVAVS